MTWLLDDAPFDPADADGYIGYVYLITNLATGKKYLGKKLFSKARTRGPLKGRVRKRRDRIESDWQDYYGSNHELNADVEKHGPAKFKREILRLCHTRGECSYWEAYHQLVNHVLYHPDQWYNGHVRVRVHGSHLRK